MDGRLVIVGAGLGGLRAAEGARRRSFRGPITMIGGEDELPYDRPPLSKDVLSGKAQPQSVTFRPQAFYDDLGVTLRVGAPATALDLEACRVAVGGDQVEFDYLVVATGATPRHLPQLRGAPNVHVLRTLADARALREALMGSRRVAIVGAGFIGGEVASSARTLGLEVTVVETQDVPLQLVLGRTLGGACAELHRRNGVDMRCGVSISHVARDADGRVVSLGLSDDSAIATDVVVVAIGVDPCIGWLDGSGLVLDGGVLCDENLQACAGRVWCVGDVAARYDGRVGRHVRVEHWTSATEQARSVAAQIAAGAAAPSSAAAIPCPYFWSEQHGLRMQLVGSGRGEVEVLSGSTDSDRLVALYRGADGLLAGALTWNEPKLCMGLKAIIEGSARWDEAVGLVRAATGTSESTVGR